MPRVSEDVIRRYSIIVLTKSGVADEDAACITDGLIQATKRGVTTHGVFRLPQYSESLRSGKINKAPIVRVIHRRGCVALVDAQGGYGFRPTTMATDIAIETAREHGAAVVGIRNSHHFGAAGMYTGRAAEAGLIALVTTTTKARIAPTGAMGSVVGNNPISIAVPRRPPNRPMILDMALSQVAMGRIRMAAKVGKPIPEGWGYDAQGRSTTDPHAIMNGGLLAAIGEHKGYGLSVMVEVLAGVMTGSPFGLEADNHEFPKGGVGHLVIAIAPDFMRDIEEFYSDVEKLVGQIRSSPLAPDSPGVFLPGEIEDRKSADADRDGLPISDDLAKQLADLSKELGIDAPQYMK